MKPVAISLDQLICLCGYLASVFSGLSSVVFSGAIPLCSGAICSQLTSRLAWIHTRLLAIIRACSHLIKGAKAIGKTMKKRT